jgi:hypothetical protein
MKFQHSTSSAELKSYMIDCGHAQLFVLIAGTSRHDFPLVASILDAFGVDKKKIRKVAS